MAQLSACYEGWSISFEPNIFKLKIDRLAYFHFSTQEYVLWNAVSVPLLQFARYCSIVQTLSLKYIRVATLTLRLHDVVGHLITVQGAALKNDPTPKMWLLSNSWQFLRQILYTCSAGSSPLTCCFSRNLLYIYEIDTMPNFKFEFCICTSIFFPDVTFCRIISKFTGKTANWTP